MIVTAWLGRRALAFAVPFVVMLASMAPGYWGNGSLAPQPIGEYDLSLWGWLVFNRHQDYSSLPIWPLVLGSCVQLGLLLVPLVAAPSMRRAPLPTRDTLLRTAVPAAGLALLMLALVQPPDGEAVLKASLCAVALTYFVVALAAGERQTWARLTAAVAIPAMLAPVVLSSYLDDPAHGAVMVAATALSSALVLFIIGAMQWARTRGTDEEAHDTSLQPVA